MDFEPSEKFVKWMKKVGWNEKERTHEIYKYEPRDVALTAWNESAKIHTRQERKEFLKILKQDQSMFPEDDLMFQYIQTLIDRIEER